MIWHRSSGIAQFGNGGGRRGPDPDRWLRHGQLRRSTSFDVPGNYNPVTPDDTLVVLPIHVTHVPGGCASPGMEASAFETPVVTVRILGRSHQIIARGPSVAFTGTAETDCDTDASDDS